MKLYSLSVLYKGEAKVVLLKAAYDVSSFSFFQRASVQEFMTFTSQLIVERSAKGSRASVKEQEYLCHVYVRNDSLAGVVIADSEYPSRVAFTLLEKVLDEFSKQVDRIEWPVGSPATIQYTALDGHLSRYQNPREADPMTKVQAELDETKIILVSRRGERGQCCGLGPAACAGWARRPVQAGPGGLCVPAWPLGPSGALEQSLGTCMPSEASGWLPARVCGPRPERCGFGAEGGRGGAETALCPPELWSCRLLSVHVPRPSLALPLRVAAGL